ncbi:hypothetical protein [Streptomyces sp. NPDC004528]|uniref:hypothetical protein n=1 Tax=Streptomyces sp. NPDC004528 TaxID=3154550 RepID=UPI0033AF9921
MAAGRVNLPRQQALPGYVAREHDQTLAAAVRHARAGHSRMVVLSGTSSTGKTRACWEAIRPLADAGWKLWHPFDPTRAEAALRELEFVRPRTVVWLNEAQHYFGDPHVGEQIASALHALLTDEMRMPVLVLGTLWPEYDRQYTALPGTGRPDPHSRVRELLAGRTVSIPESFDAKALDAATLLARDGDQLLADALTRASTHGRLTQDLAGAPELLRRYENGSPAAQALLQAAMDARRLGVGLYLPQNFLIYAATGYLADTDYDNLTEDWAETAFAELAKSVHGKQAPLRRVAVRSPGAPHPAALPSSIPGPVFRLADYLEQHGLQTRRRVCPPASFWHSAHAGLANPDDVDKLADAAHERYRLQWALHLKRRAVDAGHPDAYQTLATWLEQAGNRQEAKSLLRQAADAGIPQALMSLAFQRENDGDLDGAESLAHQAAEAGNPNLRALFATWREEDGDRERAEALMRKIAIAGSPQAMSILAGWRKEAGDHEEAETLAQQAADAGHSPALTLLAGWRKEAGDHEEAETLAQQAADAGDSWALTLLAGWREKAGDREEAEALAQQAAHAGNPQALAHLARQRERAGDHHGAETLAQQAAHLGDPSALASFVFRREEAGDREKAEALALQATAADDWTTLTMLAIRREEAGDHEGAEALARQAATGNPNALTFLGMTVMQREGTSGRKRAEALVQQGADAGDRYALDFLTNWREEAGDHEGAEALAWKAVGAGHPNPLSSLVSRRAGAGELMKAQALAWQAADAGYAHHLGKRLLTDWWPYGLDPDGTPTSAWQ